MKLCSVEVDGKCEIAIKLDGGVALLSKVRSQIQGGDSLPATLDEALWQADGLPRLQSAVAPLLTADSVKAAVVPDGQYTPAVIFTPRNILCVGLNYRDHAAESKTPIPEKP